MSTLMHLVDLDTKDKALISHMVNSFSRYWNELWDETKEGYIETINRGGVASFNLAIPEQLYDGITDGIVADETLSLILLDDPAHKSIVGTGIYITSISIDKGMAGITIDLVRNKYLNNIEEIKDYIDRTALTSPATELAITLNILPEVVATKLFIALHEWNPEHLSIRDMKFGVVSIDGRLQNQITLRIVKHINGVNMIVTGL